MFTQPSAARSLWGHQEAEQTLLSLAMSGRMPHGWIFTGPAGIGKATLAYRFARFLLYRGFSGGSHTDANTMDLFAETPHAVPLPESLAVPPEAPVFAQVAAGSHPDLLVLSPEDDQKDLGIDTIRNAAPFLSMTAAQSGWRIVIIDGAERMTRAAQNALLKVLEEPSRHAILILVANNLGKLLPTIRSRSRVLRLGTLSGQSMSDMTSVDPRIAELTAPDRETLWRMAGNSPGQMLQLLDAEALTALQHLADFIRQPDIFRANELAQGFAYQPQFNTAGRVLLWLCAEIARGNPPSGLPPVRLPAMLKFHEEAQSMLAETAQFHLDGAACWHELLGRLPNLFETAP